MPQQSFASEPEAFVKRIAKEIQRRRMERRLTVEEVADIVDIAPTTWTRYESGRGLKLEHLPKIALALDCDPKKLIPAIKGSRETYRYPPL